jgi:hypothetical protein
MFCAASATAIPPIPSPAMTVAISKPRLSSRKTVASPHTTTRTRAMNPWRARSREASRSLTSTYFCRPNFAAAIRNWATSRVRRKTPATVRAFERKGPRERCSAARTKTP